jgi:hypothetical protein
VSFEDLERRWDHLPAAEACARAWREPGPESGTWHRQSVEQVRQLLPLLARALDRLLVELDDAMPATDGRLWAPAVLVLEPFEECTRCRHLSPRHPGGGPCISYRCPCGGFTG